MMLKDKVAVIYEAGGAIGRDVACAFASDGADFFLTGRSLAPVDAVAKEVVSSGGSAEAADVEGLDERGRGQASPRASGWNRRGSARRAA